MKKIAMLALLTGMSTSVQAIEWKLSHYVGFDAQWRHMPFKKNFGDNVFPKDFPQGNAFFGLKFNDYFGVELGYLQSIERRKKVSISGPLLGVPLALDEVNVLKNKVQVNGLNAGLVGFYPMDECNQLIVGLGISRLHLRLTFSPIANELGVLDAGAQASARRNFIYNKYIVQAKIGIQRMVTEKIGLRALLSWENTKQFNVLAPKQQSARIRVSLKNSINFGLGLSWHF